MFAITLVLVFVAILVLAALRFCKRRSPQQSRPSSSVEPASAKVQTSSLSEKLYALAQTVFNQATSSHYQHRHEAAAAQVVFSPDGKTCTALTDCSGFVSYLMVEVAPLQYKQLLPNADLNSPHPLAGKFAWFFSNLTTANGGWVKVPNVQSLRCGDLIAWHDNSAQTPGPGHHNTGHVMVVAAQPSEPVEEMVAGSQIRYVSVEVIDCSSDRHFPKEELPPLAGQLQRDGLGKGTVRIVLDSEGNSIGYWEGTYSSERNAPIDAPSSTDMIGFARLVD